MPKPLGRLPGTALLDEVQGDAHHHDDGDDDEAGDLAGQCGDGACGEEQKDQGIPKPSEELEDHFPLAASRQRVGPVAGETGRSLFAAESRRRDATLGWRGTPGCYVMPS